MPEMTQVDRVTWRWNWEGAMTVQTVLPDVGVP